MPWRSPKPAPLRWWSKALSKPLARRITTTVACPTIGIGASPTCDGQVLVVDDMLGMFERVPRFVERFDDLAVRIDAAGGDLCRVRCASRAFPTEKQLYL